MLCVGIKVGPSREFLVLGLAVFYVLVVCWKVVDVFAVEIV